MTHFKKLIIATAAILSVAGNASAGEPTFQAIFSLDKNASVSEQYVNFQKAATAACVKETRKVGYRLPQSTSWERRKCERQLIEQAVKASKSKDLLAFHKSIVSPIPTRKHANK